jgi:hypothetical protein
MLRFVCGFLQSLCPFFAQVSRYCSVFLRLYSELRTTFSVLTLLFNLTIKIPCITVIMNQVRTVPNWIPWHQDVQSDLKRRF